MPLWARINVAVAVFRVAAALTLYASGASAAAASRPLPQWVYAGLAATFTIVALGLVLAHANDRRAAWLGGTLALVASPFTVPLVDIPGGLFAWLVYVRPDAFMGAFVWEFVGSFPIPVQGQRARIVQGITAAGIVAGIYLAGANLVGMWLSRMTAPPAALSSLRDVSVHPIVFYWPVLLAVTVPAFLALLWRAAVAEGAARRRVHFLVGALIVGLVPIALEVVVEGIWPAYEDFVHAPSMEPWFGGVMFAALASLPFTTAYSVLFDRVVSVRIVLHKALQYALARYSILALTLIPFGGLVLFVAQHRNEPLISLLTGARRPLVLGTLAMVGLLAFRMRPRLLAALDRRYFREPFDAGGVLERLMRRSAGGAADLGARLGEEIGRAFHARVHVLLIDDTRTVLRDAEGRLQPLSAMTPLTALADRADQVLDLNAPAAQPWIDGLPEHERQWLTAAGASVLASVHNRELEPVGLIALTPRLSELPYTADDRKFLATVAAAAGLAFDRVRPRSPAVLVSSEPPALECERCFSVYAAEARRCLCGAALVEAPVPHVLRGVFRFEQRIASGSMGVVYRAIDLSLGRNVAIKMLPAVTAERRAALVQEARAMARITHANLAVVHGVETWRDVSFLVQEYLENGTLAQRLFTSKLAVAEAIDLGLLLANLLEHLHRRSVIHCDVKPSNIGYTAEQVVKLFDFGLAQRVEDRRDGSAGESTFVGTPVYMSPEAIRGEAPSPAFDLWALTVVLYEAIAGRRPFDGATTADVLAAILRGQPPRLTELAPDTPEPIAAFFDRALVRDRASRPASASELGLALGALRRSIDESARPSGMARAGHAYEVNT